MTTPDGHGSRRHPDEHELARAVEASAALRQLLAAASAPPSTAELKGRSRAIAAFRAAHRSVVRRGQLPPDNRCGRARSADPGGRAAPTAEPATTAAPRRQPPPDEAGPRPPLVGRAAHRGLGGPGRAARQHRGGCRRRPIADSAAERRVRPLQRPGCREPRQPAARHSPRRAPARVRAPSTTSSSSARAAPHPSHRLRRSARTSREPARQRPGQRPRPARRTLPCVPGGGAGDAVPARVPAAGDGGRRIVRRRGVLRRAAGNRPGRHAGRPAAGFRAAGTEGPADRLIAAGSAGTSAGPLPPPGQPASERLGARCRPVPAAVRGDRPGRQGGRATAAEAPLTAQPRAPVEDPGASCGRTKRRRLAWPLA